MPPERYIESSNLSLVWARALLLVSRRGHKEVAPLIASITGFDDHSNFEEHSPIRAALDQLLSTSGTESVDTVANTIFPRALWNPAKDRKELFDRYDRIRPRIRRASHKNSRGVYFERMITSEAAGRENQLDFIIQAYRSRPGVGRSVLQVAIFDPRLDHSEAARLGFPCLQHVTFAPTTSGLSVNAFYATQYMVNRAYGNYVGLCRLGKFVAHELEMPLSRVTCYTGIAELDSTKRRIAPLLEAIHQALPDEETEDQS